MPNYIFHTTILMGALKVKLLENLQDFLKDITSTKEQTHKVNMIGKHFYMHRPKDNPYLQEAILRSKTGQQTNMHTL